jgi:predicted DsbA family dithiol-disulfide isomerase
MLTKIKKEALDAAEKKGDARIDLLKQEFSSSQQKFQDDIARLAAQAKDAVAAKEAAEKKLASLQSSGGTISPAGASQEQWAALLSKLFQKAWEDGVISPDERGLFNIIKNESGLSDQDFAKIENESGSASYISQLREVWKDGLVTPEEAEILETLRKTLTISAEEHFRLEAQVRKEMQQKK